MVVGIVLFNKSNIGLNYNVVLLMDEDYLNENWKWKVDVDFFVIDFFLVFIGVVID